MILPGFPLMLSGGALQGVPFTLFGEDIFADGMYHGLYNGYTSYLSNQPFSVGTAWDFYSSPEISSRTYIEIRGVTLADIAHLRGIVKNGSRRQLDTWFSNGGGVYTRPTVWELLVTANTENTFTFVT